MDLKSLETLINTKIEIFCNFEIYVSINFFFLKTLDIKGQKPIAFNIVILIP